MTTIFEVLADPRRRTVIGLLGIAPTKTLYVDAVASHIAQLEHGEPTTL